MPRRTDRLTRPILLVLGALALLGPFGTDIALPALPQIATTFSASAAAVQLILTGFTLGMAAGQLVAGPLSDVTGRRPLLLVGSAAMALASGGAAAAPSLGLLVTATAVAGLACSFGLVLSRAVIADLATGVAVTKANALLGGLLSLGPVIGPVVGVGLLAIGGWRATFAGLGAFATLVLVLVVAILPETHPPEHRLRGGIRRVAQVAGEAFRSRRFLGAAFVSWFAFIAMFAYISGSPFLIQDVLGFTPLGYSIVFGVNGVVLIVTSLLSGRFAPRLGERGLMALGIGLQAVGAVQIGIAVLTGATTPWLLLPGMLLIAAPMGFVIGPSIAEGVKDMHHAIGTTTAIIGAVQWLLAGLIAPVVSSAGRTAVWPFAVIVLAAVALAWGAWLATRPRASVDGRHRGPDMESAGDRS